MAGIYIHIPFCRQACHYCDFHFSTSLKNKGDFMKALLEEIGLQKDYLDGETVHTIYFGGGTPSLLDHHDLMSVFDELHKVFPVAGDAEITLEANPDDLSLEKLEQLKKTPINRLSIGIQSFIERDLRFMNRAHTAEEAFRSVETAKKAGFENISIDLIYGVPGLSNEEWLSNLYKAFTLEIPHISSYCLTVEEKTVLADFVRKGKVPAVDEDKAAEQFGILLNEMSLNGYTQYEISNFCREEAYSKHNSNYWMKQKYLGLGPSAHSYNGISRQWNVSNNILYIHSLRGRKVPMEYEVLSPQQRFNEYLLTSLRTIWGCSLSKIREEFASLDLRDFERAVDKFTERRLVEKKGDILTLTTEGKLLADAVTAELFMNI